MVIKMENGLVSVIIPVYNREDMIKRAVDSILSQTYPNMEVIVVDNASADHTRKLSTGITTAGSRWSAWKCAAGLTRQGILGSKILRAVILPYSILLM